MLARFGNAKMPAASVPKAVAKAEMASSVGAKTVNESVAANVLSKSASKTAASNNVWIGLVTTMSTTVPN